ncbi:MAG: TIGR02757 family protein [Phycisphaerae bacterium]
MPLRRHSDALETLYRRYNREECVYPDPVALVRPYRDVRDREVAGLLAASLAYGRVTQIHRSVSTALERLGENPAETVQAESPRKLRRRLGDFVHRFQRADDVARLLAGAGGVLRRFGSLEACFKAHLTADSGTVMAGLKGLVGELHNEGADGCGHLLADPNRGSACKRLHLFLRWMVRRDAVDPGGWDASLAEKLLVPMDVHMHRICLALGATTRRSADLRAAMEATEAFRRVRPDDPARYDFALARMGMEGNRNPAAALERLAGDRT